MASNKELVAEITALAVAKGVDVPVTEGLNNKQLAATVKGMKGPAAPAAAKPAAPAAAKPAAPAAAKPAAPAAAKPAAPAAPAAATDNDTTGNEDEDDFEPVKVERPPFYICDGKSLTTKVGILGPGDEVKVEYLIDGKDGMNRHRKNGVIAKA